MKTKSPSTLATLKSLLLGAGTLALATAGAQAQTLNKANNLTTLSSNASWVENTAPTSGSTLVFGSDWLTPGNVATGGNLNVTGLTLGTLANANGRISTSAAGQTLSIGSGGINGSAMTNTFRIDPAIILTANQSWSIAANRTLNLVANGISSSGGSFVATVTGSNGTLAFDAAGTGSYGNELQIGVTTLRVNFATTNVTITNSANTFTTTSIFSGRANFSSIGNIGTASAAGTGNVTTTLGGNNTSGVFVYSGSTTSTNRTFTRDLRNASSGIEVTTAGQTLTLTANMLTSGVQIADTNWNFGGAGNLTINGVIAETPNAFNQGVVKNGNGTLTLGGANTYNGTTTINAGTLLLSSTGSISAAGGITVAGGALELGASNRIVDTSALTMSGGSLNTGGFSETLGLLTLTANSTLDFGSGTSTVLFSGIAAGAGANVFSINNWTFGSDSLRFTSNSNLSAANFLVNGGEAAILNQGSYFEVVPEPTTWALLAMGLATLIAFHRRRAV